MEARTNNGIETARAFSGALSGLIQGDGDRAVVCLSCLGGDASTWSEVWRAAAPGRHRWIGLDLPGTGSNRSEAPRDATVERVVADIVQVVDSLGIRKLSVVGHSLGGKLALRLASRIPERIRGVALIGSAGAGPVPIERHALADFLSRVHEPAFVRDYFRPWYHVWPRAALDAYLLTLSCTPVWSLQAACEWSLFSDLSRDIGTLSVPALIIAGRHDPVYGPAYQEQQVSPSVPSARSVVVDCGHGLILERPGEIAVHLDQFLGAL